MLSDDVAAAAAYKRERVNWKEYSGPVLQEVDIECTVDGEEKREKSDAMGDQVGIEKHELSSPMKQSELLLLMVLMAASR